MTNSTARKTGARKAAPRKPPAQAAASAALQHNWQAEAQFWQLKYFEQLIHSTQIITALNRPLLGHVQQVQQQAAQAAAQANGGAPQ